MPEIFPIEKAWSELTIAQKAEVLASRVDISKEAALLALQGFPTENEEGPGYQDLLYEVQVEVAKAFKANKFKEVS